MVMVGFCLQYYQSFYLKYTRVLVFIFQIQNTNVKTSSENTLFNATQHYIDTLKSTLTPFTLIKIIHVVFQKKKEISYQIK